VIMIRLRRRRSPVRRIVANRVGRIPRVLRAHEIARSEVQLQQQHRDGQASDTTQDHTCNLCRELAISPLAQWFTRHYADLSACPTWVSDCRASPNSIRVFS
jgi:hypothetical protein